MYDKNRLSQPGPWLSRWFWSYCPPISLVLSVLYLLAVLFQRVLGWGTLLVKKNRHAYILLVYCWLNQCASIRACKKVGKWTGPKRRGEKKQPVLFCLHTEKSQQFFKISLMLCFVRSSLFAFNEEEDTTSLVLSNLQLLPMHVL